jgi:hypothetical protein
MRVILKFSTTGLLPAQMVANAAKGVVADPRGAIRHLARELCRNLLAYIARDCYIILRLLLHFLSFAQYLHIDEPRQSVPVDSAGR